MDGIESKQAQDSTNMNRIIVSYLNGRGLIFDAEDYLKLRFEHRIVGNLIGVPTSHPRNVNQQGLPAVLSGYELKLLLQREVVQLVDRQKSLLTEPSEVNVQLYRTMVERQKQELQMPAIEKRLEAFRKHLPRIVEGKRRKLLKSGFKEEDINISGEQLLEEERKRISQEKFDAMVQIPLKHPLPLDFSAASLHLSPEEEVKYVVFERLWNRGGFITTGDAFGCDFLLYPGDPMYFHASHMVHVLKRGTSQRLDVNYLVRVCRLAVVVNKLCVLAYVDELTNEVHFETIEWEGNTNKADNF
uniref:tRNA-splicing endonuclease subunit Sen34 n=1 Tax=Anopheles farauti TaxID=69004 RepID=A0A182Q2X7_9DIPT